jgi:hypothetical protein
MQKYLVPCGNWTGDLCTKSKKVDDNIFDQNPRRSSDLVTIRKFSYLLVYILEQLLLTARQTTPRPYHQRNGNNEEFGCGLHVGAWFCDKFGAVGSLPNDLQRE